MEHKFRTAMQTAVEFCTAPPCPVCGGEPVTEEYGTEAASYTAHIRLTCPDCGIASDWYPYDNYCHAIPELWAVLRRVFADFKCRRPAPAQADDVCSREEAGPCS